LNYVEKFIEKASIKHNNKYDYSKVVLCDSKTPVEIICPVHGSFFQRKDIHVKGAGCKQCAFENVPPKRSVEEFIEKASELHGNKYDYSLVTSSKSKDRIDIICQTHGVFTQTIAHHLVSRGCPECAFDTFRLSHEDFITKSNETHNSKYDYSEVNLTKGFKEQVLITCPEHGQFKQEAGSHMLGTGCRKCGNKKGLKSRCSEYTTEFFIERSKEFHGDRYSYELSEYVNTETKIKIICEVHGVFEQRPLCHIKGKGCILCRNEKTTYNFVDKYLKDPELGSETGRIYVLKMMSEDEQFLKVGITSDKRGRFKVYNKQKDIYQFEMLFEKEMTNIETALLERQLIRELKSKGFYYKPLKSFTGRTECFSLEAKDFIIETINNI
jgi:predicted  nucleic acid-binding Zn-ribbon protein